MHKLKFSFFDRRVFLVKAPLMDEFMTLALGGTLSSAPQRRLIDFAKMNNRRKELKEMIKIPLLAVVMSSVMGVTAYAASVASSYPVPVGQSQIGRYLTISNTQPSDIGLNQIVEAKIPANIKSIGGALDFALNGTGYSLLPPDQCDAFIKGLYALPLPNRDRDLNPMSLISFLNTMAGDQYQIVVDPVNRLITFKLDEQLQALYGATAGA